MKRTYAKQAERIGIAVATAIAALGIGTTLAAPPPPATPAFASANFSIATGNGGAETAAAAGSLICTFRETGLQPFQLIVYECNAAVVGALEACVYKNKLIGGSPMLVSTFKDPLAALGGEAEGLVSNNKGSINGSFTTPVPVSGGGHEGELCTEPAEAQVVAVRWCNVSLTDTANNLVATGPSELFQASYAGLSNAVPTCEALLATP
jgi:hypothetical protein